METGNLDPATLVEPLLVNKPKSTMLGAMLRQR